MARATRDRNRFIGHLDGERAARWLRQRNAREPPMCRLMKQFLSRLDPCGPQWSRENRACLARAWPQLAALFASVGDPGGVGASLWRRRGANWSNTTAADNRDELGRLVGASRRPVSSRSTTAGSRVGRARAAGGVRAAGPLADDPDGPRRGGLDHQLLRRRARCPAGGVATRCCAPPRVRRRHGARIVEGYPAGRGPEMPSAACTPGAGHVRGRGFAIAAATTSGPRAARPASSCAATPDAPAPSGGSLHRSSARRTVTNPRWIATGSAVRTAEVTAFVRSFARGRTNTAASTLVYQLSIAAW